jgi:hypothetical protein
MWTLASEELTDGRGLRFTLACGAAEATFAKVMRAWQTDAVFRAWWNALLASVPFSAYRWETPGVTAATLLRGFEFVVLDDPNLARQPDREAFAEHFGKAQSGVATFPNLRGDAMLVVPYPLAADSAYGHVAAFVREAPEAQRDALWLAVGDAMAARVSTKPVWLSTAGAGVSWLHVRLDDRPKYYGHAPYRKPPG